MQQIGNTYVSDELYNLIDADDRNAFVDWFSNIGGMTINSQYKDGKDVNRRLVDQFYQYYNPIKAQRSEDSVIQSMRSNYGLS